MAYLAEVTQLTRCRLECKWSIPNLSLEIGTYKTPRHSGHIPTQSSHETSGKQPYARPGQGDHIAVALIMMTSLKL